jgi:hypothetical protein
MSEDIISEDSIHDFLKLLGTHVIYLWNIHHGFSTCFPCGVQVVILLRYRTIKKTTKPNIILFYLTYSYQLRSFANFIEITAANYK